MIRTKFPVTLSDKNRIHTVTYMTASNRRETDSTVIWKVTYLAEETIYYRDVVNVPSGLKNEVGGDVMTAKNVIMGRNILKEYTSEDVTYKSSTFYSSVGNPSPDQIDQFFINQIDVINKREWTGTELTKIYFWHLTKDDVEVVTPEMLQVIQQPFIFEILD